MRRWEEDELVSHPNDYPVTRWGGIRGKGLAEGPIASTSGDQHASRPPACMNLHGKGLYGGVG